MTTIAQKQSQLQSDIRRFSFQIRRWKRLREMLISFREENFKAPDGFLQDAEEVLIQVLSFRRIIKENREQYDLEFLQEKLDKYVATEKYEKAVPIRDQINLLKNSK